MKWLRKVRFKLGAPFARGKFDAEMEAEMRMHLELRIEKYMNAGMPAEDARYAALREFGGLDQIKERARHQRGGLWLGNFIQDIRFGLRLLRKSPGFTGTAVLTLAIGISACAAVFSVVNAVVLHPFSYPKVDRLMVVYDVLISNGFVTSPTPADFVDYSRQSTSFESLAASYSQGNNYVIGSESIRLFTEYVTANFFNTLGVQPFLGRDFRPDEEIQDHGNVAILGYNLWQDHFAGRADVIGQTILVDDQVATIIGVMPANFQAYNNRLYAPALYMPVQGWNSLRENRHWHNLQLLGRLKDHATPAQAADELSLIARRLARQYPDTNKGWTVTVVPLLKDTVQFARPLLFSLLGAVGCLLLIACANIANLLLARAASRQKEIVLRKALGAGRSRIVRQLLSESTLLALFGGGLGVLFAHWSMGLIASILPADMPGGGNITVDTPTMIFTCGVVLLTGIGCGLAPALQSVGVDLNHALKDSRRGVGGGKRGLRLRGLFVVSEISLAVILLVSAGLLIRSFLAFEHVDRGYQRNDLFSAPLGLFQAKYNLPQNRIAFVDQVLGKLSHLHGINSAAFAAGSLETADTEELEIAGKTSAPAGAQPRTRSQIVTPEYFKTMGIPFLRGRNFTAQDTAATPLVALINQAMAKRFFPDKDPIGQRLKIALISGGPAEWREIVGIVGTIQFELDNSDFKDRVYIPYNQSPVSFLALGVRMAPGLPLDLRAISEAVHSVEADVPLTAMFDNTSSGRGIPAIRRLSMTLATVFSGVALFLATIGIYGVMAYNVAQRTGEIGIRMALGAQPGDVLRLVLAGGTRMISLGILAGLAGALASARLFESLLFNIGPYDLVTFGSITLAISSIGMIACLLPALRATKVSPMVALRCD